MRTAQEYEQPLREVVLHVDAQRELAGWDKLPDLYVVIRKDSAKTGASLIGLAPFPAWQSTLKATTHIQDSLEVACQMMEKAPDDLRRNAFPQRHLYGVALVAEAWMLKSPKADAPMTSEQMRASEEHRIHEHKDRIEIRLVQVAPVLGEPMMLVHERGQEPVVTSDIEGSGLGGGVTRLMARLAAALVSVE